MNAAAVAIPTITVVEVAPNLTQLPVSALRHKTKSTISLLLNPTKVLPCDEGIPRDWRGLAHLAAINGDHIPMLHNHPDPSGKILSIWGQTAMVHELLDILGRIDRWDIVDDIQQMIDEDAQHYHRSILHPVSPVESHSMSEENVLTVDDISRHQQGLDVQIYDAFVLFADEDIDFAQELINRMEDFGFKLCVKERDLLGGISFEHEAIMRLIAERCNRLIVIVSPSFLRSPANAFFVNFAQALGIEQGKRKIIPCLYERCLLPPQLSYYFTLDFQRSGRLWNFWDKLRESLQTPAPRSNRQRTISNVIIREIESHPIQAIKPRISQSPSPTTSYRFGNNNTITDSTPSVHYTSSLQNVNSSSIDISTDDVSFTESSRTLHVEDKQKHKKIKWFKKLLHPSSVPENENDKNKEKKKWYKRKISVPT